MKRGKYEMMTRTMFFYALSYRDAENGSYTVTQALNYAKKIIGKSDPFIKFKKNSKEKHRAELVCFSKDTIGRICIVDAYGTWEQQKEV